ncbi:MAG: hypothetical protein HC852_16470 [Acaryochloridaceae cyanobacterium RU_4_10]|nr:hypothetical protein [Acaryochloridaceae cyanobacterium RU_4_10]
MKNLTTLLGISTIVISGTIAPLNALAQTPKVEPDSKVEQPLLGNPVPLSQKWPSITNVLTLIPR